MLENFITAFIVYFVVIDPIGNSPIFLAVTAHLSKRQKIRTAVEGSIVAAAVMLFFALCGAWILHYLAVSFSAVKIAGGIILLLVAIQALAVTDPAFFENFKNATLCDHAHHLCLTVPVITDGP